MADMTFLTKDQSILNRGLNMLMLVRVSVPLLTMAVTGLPPRMPGLAVKSVFICCSS